VPKPTVPFEIWKMRLLEDAAAHDQRNLLQYIPDHALGLFWHEGCAPTIEALTTPTPQRSLPQIDNSILYYST
jgi:hypothetical protein